MTTALTRPSQKARKAGPPAPAWPPPESPKLLYVFAVVAPVAVNLTMFLAQENVNLSALAGLRWGDFVRLFFVNILLAPLWEEIGWRGYLLPILSKQIGLGRAALPVGLIWGSWHFVLYHSVVRVSLYSYLIRFGVIVAMALLLAVLYSTSNNMLLLPILFVFASPLTRNPAFGELRRCSSMESSRF